MTHRFMALLLLLVTTAPLAAQMVTGARMRGWHEALGLDATSAPPLTVTYLGGVGANVLWPGERPRFRFQVVNQGTAPIRGSGRLLAVPYMTRGIPGDIWTPEVVRLSEPTAVPLEFAIDVGAHQDVEATPDIGARFGGYALILELPDGQRIFGTSCVRIAEPQAKRVQYPQFCQDITEPELLLRLGASPNRVGIGYKPTTDEDFAAWWERDNALNELRAYREHGISVTLEIGCGDWLQPEQALGMPRPHLNADGVMQQTKTDIAWMPSYDADFRLYVQRILREFGWPRGPINGIKLWNEPWEGISISGWGADMPRYREIFLAMAEATRAVCAEEGLEVLIGGCDSSSNTLDKLFGDGDDTFLQYLDFLSIHYQGMQPHSTVKAWVDRQHPNGRVRIWDTESWVANVDDRVATVLATNLSTGHNRAVGVYHGNVATETHAMRKRVIGPDGEPLWVRSLNTWSVAAAVAAGYRFIGERRFQELLFRNGLPWVMVFAGDDGVDDGTVVVIGDIGEAFGADSVPFREARGVVERQREAALHAELAALPADADPADRTRIEAAIARCEPLSGATLTLPADPAYALYDAYGNALPATGGTLVVPLDHRGFYLRGTAPGGFAKVLTALRSARIDGIEPLHKVVHDFTQPIAAQPSLQLELTNVLNRPVAGTLAVQVDGLTLDQAEQALELLAHETRTISLRVTAGTATPDNRYPLSMVFDAGADGRSEHREDLRVNWIARKTPVIDGKLDDWGDAIPLTMTSGGGGRTLQEAAWLPFVPADPALGKGVATVWTAWDDDHFYIAAKIADDTPHPGTLRFATRDDEPFFYPEVSYSRSRGPIAENFSIRWRGFVQARVSGRHELIVRSDDGARLFVDERRVVDQWVGRGPTDDRVVVDLTAGERLPVVVEYFQGGGGCMAHFDWVEPAGKRMRIPAEVLFQEATGDATGLRTQIYRGMDLKNLVQERIDAQIDYRSFHGDPAAASFGVGEEILREHHWPEGVRRYSYRTNPILPAGNAPNFDNVQIAFNVLPEDEKWKYSHPPGTMPRYTDYVCSDYEFALNQVAEGYGGGTEIWRLKKPGLAPKHFYPRQNVHPLEGAAAGKLVMTRDASTRYVEMALPWSEIPHVKARIDAQEPVKFSVRVNDNAGIGCLELARGRSVAKRNLSFSVDWTEHWANELIFGVEQP